MSRNHQVNGYYDYVLGKFGPLPDDAEALKHGLDFAIRIIGSYERDARHIGDYLKNSPNGDGFCQGEVYREAVADIFRAMERPE
jgi:hypothetical protein